MPRIKLKQVDQISRTTVSCAFGNFMRHCKLKNLSPYSYLYYEKNISFFLAENPEIKYVDEITWERIESFISKLMDRGIISVKKEIFLYTNNMETIESCSFFEYNNANKKVRREFYAACKERSFLPEH